MEEDFITELFINYEDEIDKAISYLKSELNSLRAGRANPKILDKIMVSYYGTMTPINQMANISVQDGRMLVISLWDTNAMKDVLKAISASDIGITPTDDGRIIRLVFPPLTEERRIEMVKTIKRLGEDCKVAARNARRNIIDEIKKLKKNNDISEDEQATQEKEIQKVLDKKILNIETEISNKEKELMQI